VSQLSNNFPAAKVKHLTNLISQPVRVIRVVN
jgi:hypothetical protein